jgi:Cu/Ag efflux pump CusA
VLRDVSTTVIGILRQVPVLHDVNASQDSGNRELSVHVDREKAKDYGFLGQRRRPVHCDQRFAACG